MSERWYVATIITQCKVADADQASWTLDEQICVLQAANGEVAYDKAVQLGKSTEHSYPNSNGDEVRWTFLGLNNLEELVGNSITDGTEIRSRLFESDNPSGLVRHKDNLLVNWAERNKNRTSADILNDAANEC